MTGVNVRLDDIRILVGWCQQVIDRRIRTEPFLVSLINFRYNKALRLANALELAILETDIPHLYITARDIALLRKWG